MSEQTGGERAVRNVLEDAARDGWLPPDLMQILANALVPAAVDPETSSVNDPPSAGQRAAPEDDLFDEATVPRAVAPRTETPRAPATPAASPLPPLPSAAGVGGNRGSSPEDDAMRSRVDDVVLSSLIGDFQGMREGRGEASGTQRPDALDGLLSNYRSARFRADARRAVRDGASDGKKLGAFGDLGQVRAGIGSILRDRFILDAEIGRGGMGIVYSAVDRRRLEAGSAQPHVALKLLNDAFRKDSHALRVLESEARKTQSLAHPNIATVYDFDRDRAEVFIVMELLSGRPLSRHLAEAMGQAMPGERIARILEGICNGLSHAHERGIVHADLKPGNIFVSGDNSVKLLDFGLSTAGTGGGYDASELNALTAPYASPEMFEGAERDPRDDIFALGCIAYQLLAGTHPFAMKSTSEAAAEGMAPDPIGDLDPTAWKAIERALSFDRATRTASVGAFFEELFET